MPLTPEDVHAKQFSTVRMRNGYDMDEVDRFLDEVETELVRLHADADGLRQQLAVAQVTVPPMDAAPIPAPIPAPAEVTEPVAPAAAPMDTSAAAVRMLELAQKTADEHLAVSQAEADKLLSDAQGRAAAIARDSDQQRIDLERRLEELRAFEREYRTRLRSYLQAQLHELDTRADAAPAGAPASTAPAGAPAGAQVDGPPPLPTARFDLQQSASVPSESSSAGTDGGGDDAAATAQETVEGVDDGPRLAPFESPFGGQPPAEPPREA